MIKAADKYGADYYVPPADAPQEAWMKNNEKWMDQEVIDKGRPVIDIGPEPGRANYPEPTSPYFQVERDRIRARGYTRYVQRPRP